MNANELVAWEGAEEWEPLAWELCADEHGEESCNDLIWDMGVIPEPWGERWQKYEDEAKRMIAMVRKCTHPVKELTDEEIAGAVARGWCSEKNSMKTMDSDLSWAIVEELKVILRKAQKK